jgi:hypothetical protein
MHRWSFDHQQAVRVLVGWVYKHLLALLTCAVGEVGPTG